MRTFSVLASTLLMFVSSAIALVAMTPIQAAAPDWHVVATLAESCSCAISCPCNFGGKPSHDPCQGNRLISISKGHVGDVDVSGVSFLVAWELGTWTDVTIDAKVTDRQRAALESTVMPLAFSSMRRSQLQVTTAPIAVDMTATHVRFSTPQSTVDMDVMNGSGGQPVKILNLPSALYQDYTQFRSVVHEHTNGEHTFSHSGTNGFTSTWEAGSR